MALAVASLGTAGAIGLLSLSQDTPLQRYFGNRSGDYHIEFSKRMIGKRAHFQGPDVKH